MPGVVLSPSRPASCGVGPHRDQVAAAVDPVGEHRDLAGAERDLAEDRRRRSRRARRRDVGDVGGGELVEPLGAQDLRVVAAERVGARWRSRGSARPGPRRAAAVAGAAVVNDQLSRRPARCPPGR